MIVWRGIPGPALQALAQGLESGRIAMPVAPSLLERYVGREYAHKVADELASLRRDIRDRTRVATMFGYGPRYLHSTGQLHKGGANTGVFILVSAAPQQDLPIPGEPFSFGTLELAQALGDFASLEAAGRRALHAHLRSPSPALLHTLATALLARVGTH